MDSKRAMEWPTFLISTIFSMFLFFIGVFMIFNVATAHDIKFERGTDLLEYGLLASRMLNSADCLAWEEKTPIGYLVHAGVVDASKLAAKNPNNCISGKAWWVGIDTDKDGDFDFTNHNEQIYLQNNVLKLNNQNLDAKYYDWFAVKIYFDGNFYDGKVLVAIKYD